MRLWALYGLEQQVIGAVFRREDAPVVVTAASPLPWFAVVSQARLGDATSRETLDGRRFDVRPIIGEWLQQWTAFETEAAAFEHLDDFKATNVAAGWVEYPLDPINDPD